MATSDVREQLQTTLGDAYRIERELPPGGMSRLFLATESSLDRQVVIKLLPPEYASEVSAARFQREVTLTAHLQHPHILPILSAGSKNGLLYYVMPYVDGESLRQRLQREGKLPVPLAVQILRDVADALARAHKAGVVHRDIKPENILLQEDRALLADFGVARALHEATGSERLTETGMGLGTPGYMAPEQLAGDQHVDARVDVYALAVVGYEMLAGVAPFTGATPQAVAAAHFTIAPKPVVQLRPEVTSTVGDALTKALSKNPDQRFATAGEFRDGLAGSPYDPQGRKVNSYRWVAVGAIVLALTGSWFGWRILHPGAASVPSGPIRLAVLPFENLGDTSDAYFADGVTDAVRGKLTALPELEVIGSGSSGQYRRSTKSPQQIARELAVRYLLVGRVRWQKRGLGRVSTSRVQVSPELIEATSGAAKWAQPFDAPLTDVFNVQTDIAGQVAQQLRIALSPSARQSLGTQPTTKLDAYDAYLRGREIEKGGIVPATARRAVAAYQEAVRRDSSFALAWAMLSAAQSLISSGPTDDSTARHAMERALALAPTLPEARAAEGMYNTLIRHDNARALAAYQEGLRYAPNSGLLIGRSGYAELRLGHWKAALSHLERAARLDPLYPLATQSLGNAYFFLRRYREAAEVFDRGLTREPSNVVYLTQRIDIALAQGDPVKARAILHSAPATVDSADLLTSVDTWLLDSAQLRVLLALTPAAFDGDRGQWGISCAQAFSLRHNDAKERAYADSARVAFESRLRASPDDPSLHAFLGLAFAHLRRRSDAMREGERAVALQPVTSDAISGSTWQTILAESYMRVGEAEKAVGTLQQLLSSPAFLSPDWLRIDPTWAPLKGNPRFERLIAQPPSITSPTA